MDYANYISGIDFRFLKPNMKPSNPKVYKGLKKLIEKFGTTPEFINTSIPDDERGIKATLREIGNIPRMSTLAIGAMINRGISQMPDNQVFLNIGVWNGFTFLSGIINNPQKKCIGVDNFSQFGSDVIPIFGDPREAFYERFNKNKSPNHYFYDMDYIEYFSNVHKEPIGFYIYDGEHSYENQLKGLQVAEPFLAEDCIILIDDTNWDEPRQATFDFISNSSYEYQTILDKTTYCDRHPTLWNGIMILQKVN